MKRNLLAAAAAAAPLLAAAAPALAQATTNPVVTISSSTSTPVTTATAGPNNTPSDVIVSGSIGLTTAGTAGAPITALTLNSNNNVSVTGSLGATGLNYVNGLNILGGFTGSATNQGSINLTETYTPPADPNNNGLYTGLFAQGSNRIGLEVTGSGAFTGNNATVVTSSGNIIVNGVTNTGTISVTGNNSDGVYIAAPIVGDFMSSACVGCTATNAATTPTTAPIVLTGTVTVTGQQSVGFDIAPTGGVTGNVRLGTVSATGPGAQAAIINGDVGGYLDISGALTTTGYRTTTRQTDPLIAALYSQMEMQQGGASLTIGGSIANGLIISAPPPNAGTGTTYANNTYLNTNGQNLNGLLIPDVLQGSGSVVSFGQAPAIQIGAASGAAITLGAYSASDYLSVYNGTGIAKTGQFGFVNQGSILGESLFDQLTTPYLLNPVSATALQIGGTILVNPQILTFNTGYQPVPASTTTNILQTGVAAVTAASGAVNIAGGVYNSGTIAAYAYQADATAIHVGAGASLGTAGSSTPSLYNDGVIYASSTQVNSATTVTVYPGYGANAPIMQNVAPVTVTAIQIDPGASVTSIANNSGILAELTGSSGVGGAVRAIIDNSGSLSAVTNTGSITAYLNQTDINLLMPTNTATLTCQTCTPTATSIAIDMQYGTVAQTITQSSVQLALPAGVSPTPYVVTTGYTTLNTVVSYLGNYYVNVAEAAAGYDPIDYPQYWREIGAVNPSIAGDIYMGSASDTLNIEAGSVAAGNIWMGGATNTINVGTSAATATVQGSITETAGGQFVFNVVNGTLADYNPALNQLAKTIYVGPTGVLTVTVDPANGRNTQFQITGSATIAPGGQIGLSLATLQTTPNETYTIMYGAPGTISATALGATTIGNTPYLYTAAASYVASSPASTAIGAAPAGDSAINLTVALKSASQLGFNAAEAAAYVPILTTLQTPTAANQGIQDALLGQSTQSGLKSIYDQLLPNQNQGIFQALDAAVEKVSGFTQTPPDNATTLGGESLWVQEVNERVDRSGIDTLGSDAQLLGIVGGYERMGSGGGAIGVTLGYYNASENTTAAQLGANDVGSLVEGSIYYRRQDGPLTLDGRVGGGYGWFNETRVFAYGSTIEQANGNWTGGFIDAHLGASYEIKLFGPYYARPEVSIDYLRLAQSGYQETGANSAFNLKVGPQTDTQLTAQGLMVFGRQWGKATWFRSEVRMGWREVLDGSVGDTTASFDGGTPFQMLGDPDRGGWATVGFSLKTGSQFSYLALEGDADIRKGQQRYDLRVAGRSVF